MVTLFLEVGFPGAIAYLAGVEGCADGAVGILGGQDLHIQAVQGKGIYLYLFGELRDGDLQGPIPGNLGGWGLFAAAGSEQQKDHWDHQQKTFHIGLLIR